jgi:hypothetical protein
MKMRSLFLLLALVVAACGGTNGALPASPSDLKGPLSPFTESASPSTLAGPLSPATESASQTEEIGPNDPGSPLDLSFDDVGSTPDVTKLGFVTSGATSSATGPPGYYTGAFGGTGRIAKAGSTCTWSVTYKGVVSLSLGYAKGGRLNGLMRLDGTWKTPRSSARCAPGSGPFFNEATMVISGTKITKTGLSLGLSTGAYSGNLSGNKVTGTLTAKYKFGTGTLVMKVVLVK